MSAERLIAAPEGEKRWWTTPVVQQSHVRANFYSEGSLTASILR